MKRTRRRISSHEHQSSEDSNPHEVVREGLWRTNPVVPNQQETIDYKPRERDDFSKPTQSSKEPRDYHNANKSAFTRRQTVTPTKESAPVLSIYRPKQYQASPSSSIDENLSRQSPAVQKGKINKRVPLAEVQMQDRPKITPYKLKKDRDTMYRTERSKDILRGEGKNSLERKEERELMECTFRPHTNGIRKPAKAAKNHYPPDNDVSAKAGMRKDSEWEVWQDPHTDQLADAKPVQHTRDPCVEEFNLVGQNDPGETVVGRNAEELLKWGREKDSKLAAKRVQAASSIEKECTFNPKLNPRSSKIPLKGYVPPDQRYHTKFTRQSSKNLDQMDKENFFRPKINEKSIEILKRRQQACEKQSAAKQLEEENHRYLAENLHKKSFSCQSSAESYMTANRDSRQESSSPNSKGMHSKLYAPRASRTLQKVATGASRRRQPTRSPMKTGNSNNPQLGQIWRSPSESISKRRFADNGMPILNTSVAKPRIKDRREQAKKAAAEVSLRSRSKSYRDGSQPHSKQRLRNPRDEEAIINKFRTVGERLGSSIDRTLDASSIVKEPKVGKPALKIQQIQTMQKKKICEQPVEMQDMPLKRKNPPTDTRDTEQKSPPSLPKWSNTGLDGDRQLKQHQKKIRRLIYLDQPVL
jgi:hypothetical protein